MVAPFMGSILVTGEDRKVFTFGAIFFDCRVIQLLLLVFCYETKEHAEVILQ